MCPVYRGTSGDPGGTDYLPCWAPLSSGAAGADDSHGAGRLTAYESGNLRRLVTGALFGFGLAELFLLSTAAVFRCGVEIGEKFLV